jgi:hypothetical protein
MAFHHLPSGARLQQHTDLSARDTVANTADGPNTGKVEHHSKQNGRVEHFLADYAQPGQNAPTRIVLRLPMIRSQSVNTRRY